MTEKTAPDLYALLAVDPTAGDTELDHAFRVLARRLHPDMHSPDADSDAFQQLLAAYSVLRDPIARSTYDQHRAATAPPAGNLDKPTPAAPPSRAPTRTPPGPALRIGPVHWRPSPSHRRSPAP